MSKEWKPRIVAFFCNWCTYTAADLAGVSRLKYAANTALVPAASLPGKNPQLLSSPFRV